MRVWRILRQTGSGNMASLVFN